MSSSSAKACCFSLGNILRKNLDASFPPEFIGNNQNRSKLDIAKTCDRTECRKLHVDGDNSFVSVELLKHPPIFTIDRIGRPDTTPMDVDAVFVIECLRGDAKRT